jgi:hypothetical protein
VSILLYPPLIQLKIIKIGNFWRYPLRRITSGPSNLMPIWWFETQNEWSYKGCHPPTVKDISSITKVIFSRKAFSAKPNNKNINLNSTQQPSSPSKRWPATRLYRNWVMKNRLVSKMNWIFAFTETYVDQIALIYDSPLPKPVKYTFRG